MKSKIFSWLLSLSASIGSFWGTSGLVCAQSAIPNGNFETWNAVSYENPTNCYSSNDDIMPRCGVANSTKTTDAYAGSYAIKLITVPCGTNTAFGYFANTQPDDNFPNWPGGSALNAAPTGIQGYYKGNIISPDTARLVVVFKKNGSVIGFYGFSFYGNHSSYTAFNFTFSPALSVTPDSVIIAAASSNFYDESMARVGSTLYLDNISFTGIATQPALFDGNFENWTTTTNYVLDGWSKFSSDGIARTTDRAAGSYAVELTTRQGERNGNPTANGAFIGTGDWMNSCQCWTGGYPFSNATDTLKFQYKYNGLNNDTAEVFLAFRKNGSQIDAISKRITSTTGSNFQTAIVPFSLWTAPDTVVVTIQSSIWSDSALAYVGSKLIIDEIQFTSQPLTTFRMKPQAVVNATVYPNPFSSQAILRIDTPVQEATLTIENSFGQTVKEFRHLSGNLIQIHRENLPAGLYSVRLQNNGTLISIGKVLITD